MKRKFRVVTFRIRPSYSGWIKDLGVFIGVLHFRPFDITKEIWMNRNCTFAIENGLKINRFAVKDILWRETEI